MRSGMGVGTTVGEAEKMLILKNPGIDQQKQDEGGGNSWVLA